MKNIIGENEMTKFRYLIAILFIVLMSSVEALPSNSENVPSNLMFSGKPVDSLCFFNLESNSNLIHLKNCGVIKEKFTITGHDDSLIKKGYIGFNWQDPDSKSQGDSYYKIFSAGPNQYWIYTINNSGGSGVFTSINLVKPKNIDTLEIESIMSGDRCNGGVQDVAEHNKQLSYSVNLTASDFLSLANKNPHHIKAYDDLSACAVCCSAKAFYEVDSSLKPKLKYVELNQNETIADMPSQGTYQACFNKLLASYISKKEMKLNQEKLTNFVNQFNETCVK
jgi:hypothetical protein